MFYGFLIVSVIDFVSFRLWRTSTANWWRQLNRWHLFDCNFFFVSFVYRRCCRRMDKPLCIWLYYMEKTKLNDAKNSKKSSTCAVLHTIVLRGVRFHTYWNLLLNKFDFIILAFMNCVFFLSTLFWELAHTQTQKAFA